MINILICGLRSFTPPIDYRGARSAPGLETPIVYIVRCGPKHDEIILVPVTRKRLNTFCSYFTHRIVIINYIASY